MQWTGRSKPIGYFSVPFVSRFVQSRSTNRTVQRCELGKGPSAQQPFFGVPSMNDSLEVEVRSDPVYREIRGFGLCLSPPTPLLVALFLARDPSFQYDIELPLFARPFLVLAGVAPKGGRTDLSLPVFRRTRLFPKTDKTPLATC